MPDGSRALPARRACCALLLVLGICTLTGAAGPSQPTPTPAAPAPAAAAPPAPAGAPAQLPLRVVPAPKDLPHIDYLGTPRGLPADPDPLSTVPVTAGLRPGRRLAVYDAPGGRPRAVLPRSISGLPVTVPIVARRAGWVAVLLPSTNRHIGWVPPHGWQQHRLRDQLILRRRTHELTWLRDGVRRASWTVATGAARTPTPRGRTFVLGRTGTRGAVYAGLDALVLAAVPDDRDALAPALRAAHTGIHGWSRSAAFGRSVSNGCVRVPPAVQRILLRQLTPGATVHVVD